MGSKIPIIFCIDVEPDDRKLDLIRPLPWSGFEASFLFFRELRGQIEANLRSTAYYSWFVRMDPQIEKAYGHAAWAVKHYSPYLEEMRRHGDEVGLHVHPTRWDEEGRDWVNDFSDLSWVKYCVRSSIKAFAQAMGRSCESFRFGDAWLDAEVLELLQEAGIQFDLTLEPGFSSRRMQKTNEKYLGTMPDLSQVPLHPYRCSKSDFRLQDPHRKAGVWLIPLSTGRLSGIFDWALRAYRVCFYRFISGRVWVTLNPFYNPPIFRQVMEGVLRSTENPYLALILRTDSVLHPYLRRNIKKNLKYLMTHPLKNRFVFSTPREAMTHLSPQIASP